MSGVTDLTLLDFFSLNRLPRKFSEYVIDPSSCSTLSELSPRTFLLRSESGLHYVFKTVENDSPLSYHSLIASLFSIRFYFLAPVQGFSIEQRYGFFYTYYQNFPTLQSAVTVALPATTKMLIAAFVCYGMAYLEASQLIHGTLHSGNILLSRDMIPIITDYGLARSYSFFEKTDANDGIAWIAPEVLLSGRGNFNADIYAFGVILFELFEGRRPFSGLSNREILVGRRLGVLRKFDFSRTPEKWQEFIGKLTDDDPDQRPSFAEVYYLFQQGTLLFPGADPSVVAHVLSLYSLSQVFTPGEMPVALSLPDQSTPYYASLIAIVANPSHPQFTAAAIRLAENVNLFEASVLCQTLASVATPSYGALLVKVANTLCDRDFGLREIVMASPLIQALSIPSRDYAQDLMRLVVPVFRVYPGLLTPLVYHAAACLAIYLPAETLNLFAYRFTNHPPDLNTARFFLGLWLLYCGSGIGDRYISIVSFLMSVPGFEEIIGPEAIGVAVRFSACSSSVCVFAGSLFLLQHCRDALNLTASSADLVARNDERRTEGEVILLLSKTLPVSPEFVRSLIRWVRLNHEGNSWAILSRYAVQSELAAISLLQQSSWIDPDLGRPPLQVLLAVFSHARLRGPLSRHEEFGGFLKMLCVRDDFESLNMFHTLIHKIPLDKEYIGKLSMRGVISAYLEPTLVSDAAAIVRLGIDVVELLARVEYVNEFGNAVTALLNLMKTRIEELGDDLIKVMSTLSRHKQCLQPMKDFGLVQYYEGLVAYEQYAGFARFFLVNASN
jgi:serine/threonine protein kinase